jgi:uncharacterized membrane protein YqjE
VNRAARKPENPDPHGVFAALRRLADTSVAILETRLALFATDIEEARDRLLRLMLWGVTALFFFCGGLLLAALFLVVVFWDTHRLLAIGSLSALFLGSALALSLAIARSAREPRIFSATLKEFARDRECLSGTDEH